MVAVACVGIAVLDLIYEVDELPSIDTKMRARRRRESGGGMAAGAAVASMAIVRPLTAAPRRIRLMKRIEKLVVP